MGFWFFLSVALISHLLLRVYKIRVSSQRIWSDSRIDSILKDLKIKDETIEAQKKRIDQLEEVVFFGDFELEREFNKLKREPVKHSTL